MALFGLESCKTCATKPCDFVAFPYNDGPWPPDEEKMY